MFKERSFTVISILPFYKKRRTLLSFMEIFFSCLTSAWHNRIDWSQHRYWHFFVLLIECFLVRTFFTILLESYLLFTLFLGWFCCQFDAIGNPNCLANSVFVSIYWWVSRRRLLRGLSFLYIQKSRRILTQKLIKFVTHLEAGLEFFKNLI